MKNVGGKRSNSYICLSDESKKRGKTRHYMKRKSVYDADVDCMIKNCRKKDIILDVDRCEKFLI